MIFQPKHANVFAWAPSQRIFWTSSVQLCTGSFLKREEYLQGYSAVYDVITQSSRNDMFRFFICFDQLLRKELEEEGKGKL